MAMKGLLSGTIVLSFLLASCQEAQEHASGSAAGVVRAEFSGYQGDTASASPDAEVRGMAGYHFENGTLRYIYDSFRQSGAGYDLKVNSAEGMLYLVAWTGESMLHSQPVLGTTEEDWLKTSVTTSELFFSGKVNLSGTASGALPVSLRRGLARFDLEVDVEGEAHVRSAVIRNALQEGWLFAREEVTSVPDAAVGEVVLAPSAYLHEQVNPRLTVAVDALIDGREYSLEAPLPSTVLRNTRYTVTLRKESQNQELSLEVVSWKDGGTSELLPDRSGMLAVDAGKSRLPLGAALYGENRILELPHTAVDFTLYLTGDERVELVSADGYLLEVTPLPSDNVSEMNAFRIRKRLYAPGVERSEVKLQFRREGLSHVYPDDNIILRLQPNPTVVEGVMDFDSENYEYDFGKYVDNELGVFVLPEKSQISVEFEEGEDSWLKLSPSGNNTWRVLGGWRPNDPTANGRRQKAVIVVSDGNSREEYTIVRRNYGLPVTWLHGIWWCKYNAMGRSDSFEDQILSSADPAAAAGMTLYDYLADCSPEEYRRLWQWAYQGSSGQGMKVVQQDGLLVMDQFSMDVPDHINRLPADALSPAGYELPSMDDFNRIFDATDYIWLMWNGTHTLKNPWNGHTQIKREQRRKNDVSVGDMTISDLIYIAMWSPDYPEHEPVVWYGPGAQWNADGILHAGHYNNILFGVHSPSGEGWYMAGGMNAFYLHRNGAGNRDTRILRFRKSDVEYVY